MKLRFFQGDTIEITFQAFKNKSGNQVWNLSDCDIRFQMSRGDTIIKKASDSVIGGDNEQIEVLNEETGTFMIKIPKEESENITPGLYSFAIQITTDDSKKSTIMSDDLTIEAQQIKWEDLDE